MKPKILEQLSWEDLKEIDDVFWELSIALYSANKEYYIEALNRLKEKAE